MRWLGGVTCNTGGFAGVGVINVQKGGRRDTNDLLSGSHCGLQSGNGAGAVPHSDAVGQNALSGGSVKRVHNGGQDSCSSQFPQNIESLFSYFGQRCAVDVSIQVFGGVCTQAWHCSPMQSWVRKGLRTHPWGPLCSA